MPRPGRTQSRLSPARKSTAKVSADAEAWVKKTRQKMTLEEKLGQLLMVPYYGGFTSSESPEFLELARQVERNHVGGLMLQTRPGPLGIERSRAYPAAALANLLQGRARVPLLVGADFERGTAMRIEEGTSFPFAMAIAATGRPEDAYTVGRITALEARAVGVGLIFAPVADVNSDPDNPIINMRSFGEDPRQVGKFVSAFVRGVQENGGLATAKHFPGHGDTSTDSHLDLPRVDSDLAHLEHVELPPFRAAISAGVSAIMTGHLAVPALEPNPELPATLSGNITKELLRRQMKFNGLVVTDDLNMGGVTTRYSPAEVAVRAILAGSDILLAPPQPDAALAGLREAVAAGRLPLSRVDDAVTNILRAKARLGLHKSGRVNLDALAATFGRLEFDRAAEEIADRGVTLLRDTPHLLPLDGTRPTRALLIAIAGDPDRYPAKDFERELRGRVDSLQTLRFDTRFVRTDTLQLPSADSYDVMIVGIFVRFADRKGNIALPDDQVAVVQRLLSTNKPVIIVCFGSPYVVARFPEAETWLAVFSPVDVAQRAAARAVFGETAITGRIPVNVPGVAPLGAGIEVLANPMKLAAASPAMEAKLAAAYGLLDRAVADRAFPGGVLAAGYRGELALHAFGKQSYEHGAKLVTPDTIYDAASLTKPVVTATLVAMLAESSQLDLDARIARYLPEWAAGPNPEWRARVTMRLLLTHTSGLPAREDYFRTLKTRREIVARVLAEPLAYEPGTQSVYSDLGFILLGEIVERLSGEPLDQLARERIFAPLGMKATMFAPPKPLRARIAPTENDTQFRHRLLRGEVHDENAWVMGGIAGHAGMFANAADLSAFCQMLLNGGLYAHQRTLRRQTIAEFVRAEPLSAKTHTLGWMARTTNSTSGRYFSEHSFGYLGFTGGSIWIDPDKQLFVVLLTNRVHPTRENDKIARVRRTLHDAIVEGLNLGGLEPR
jgi:beta-N-acetylhexosaminidase